MRVAEFQQRFQRAIVAPMLVTGDAELAIKTDLHSFPGEGQASPRYRISIHHRHFWSRMHDFAAYRYPLLMRCLGDVEFDELVRHYIAAHPPMSFTTSAVVESLAAFLATHEPWSASPILAHLAAFDFQRSGLKLASEEATVSAVSLLGVAPDALARVKLRLKRRAMVTTTRAKFRLEQIHELPRDTALDDQPTYWFSYMAKRGCITREVDRRRYAALQCLAGGIAIKDLIAVLERLGFAIVEIDAFVDRCLGADVLVAEGPR